ncbi:uncharacterized protein [Ptychodera flava]|uniref:uncharacterized protein n=1 Tax=Ptychodera flava TaxID=63121 RepID=UPI00396A07F7
MLPQHGYQRLFLWSTCFCLIAMVIFYANKSSWIQESEKYGTERGKKKTGTPIEDDFWKTTSIRYEPTRSYNQVLELGDINANSVTDSKVSPTSFSEVGFRGNNDTPTRYLLPVKSAISGGASFQYKRLKVAVRFALLTNRTLVLTPFVLDGGHVRGFSEDRVRSFESTFDVKKAEALLPLATINQYIHECNDKRSTVLAWNFYGERYETVREKLFQPILGINLPEADQVHPLPNNNDFDEVGAETENETCVALSVDGHFIATKPLIDDDIAKTINKGLTPAEEIRIVGKYFSDRICQGESYLAYHWRNMSAEMPCFFGRENKEVSCADRLKEIRKLAEIASDSVVDLVMKENVKCLYVACPLWSLEIVDILSKRMPRKDIIISGDLDVPDEYKPYFEDYYFLALVEQEIAFHAAIFISAGKSNWSDFVKGRRESEGKVTYNIRELAGLTNVSYNMV